MNFFFFSDVWLDQADTLRGLQKIFDNCIENNFIPKVIVFCGNFTSSGTRATSFIASWSECDD